jgi:hypothetical protein
MVGASRVHGVLGMNGCPVQRGAATAYRYRRQRPRTARTRRIADGYTAHQAPETSMQIRERRTTWAFIRTTYDKTKKRGVATSIGTLPKSADALPQELAEAMTEQERAQAESLVRRMRLAREAYPWPSTSRRLGTRTPATSPRRRMPMTPARRSAGCYRRWSRPVSDGSAVARRRAMRPLFAAAEARHNCVIIELFALRSTRHSARSYTGEAASGRKSRGGQPNL